MEIFSNKELTESVLQEDGSFKLDVGVCMAGGHIIKEFYVKNPHDSELVNIHMTLKPVTIIENGVTKDYTKCLQEIEVILFPKHLKPFESKKFEIKYNASESFLRGLRFNMEIIASELYS